MLKALTCKREGDEVVIRIPIDFPAPVVAFVAASGGVSGGWAVLEGATSEIPAEARNLLSTSPVPVDRLCVDLFRSGCGDSSPQTPTTHCHSSRSLSPRSSGEGHPAASSPMKKAVGVCMSVNTFMPFSLSRECVLGNKHRIGREKGAHLSHLSVQRRYACRRQAGPAQRHQALIHSNDMLELGVRTERGSRQQFSLVHQRVINFYVHARNVPRWLQSVDSHFPARMNLSMPALYGRLAVRSTRKI